MIRLAVKGDLKEVSALWVDMVNELKNDWKPDPTAWIKNAENFLDSGLCEIILAEEKGSIVGFLEGIVFYDPCISKNRSIGQYFYVIPEYRNTKVADSLYEEILVQSLIRDGESLELFCLSEKEEYWEKKGFSKYQSVMRMEL